MSRRSSGRPRVLSVVGAMVVAGIVILVVKATRPTPVLLADMVAAGLQRPRHAADETPLPEPSPDAGIVPLAATSRAEAAASRAHDVGRSELGQIVRSPDGFAVATPAGWTWTSTASEDGRYVVTFEHSAEQIVTSLLVSVAQPSDPGFRGHAEWQAALFRADVPPPMSLSFDDGAEAWWSFPHLPTSSRLYGIVRRGGTAFSVTTSGSEYPPNRDVAEAAMIAVAETVRPDVACKGRAIHPLNGVEIEVPPGWYAFVHPYDDASYLTPGVQLGRHIEGVGAAMLWVGDLRAEIEVDEVLESIASEMGLGSAGVRQTSMLESGTASWLDGAGQSWLGGEDRRRAGVVTREGSKFAFIIVASGEGGSDRLIDEATQLTIRTVCRTEGASR